MRRRPDAANGAVADDGASLTAGDEAVTKGERLRLAPVNSDDGPTVRWYSCDAGDARITIDPAQRYIDCVFHQRSVSSSPTGAKWYSGATLGNMKRLRLYNTEEEDSDTLRYASSDFEARLDRSSIRCRVGASRHDRTCTMSRRKDALCSHELKAMRFTLDVLRLVVFPGSSLVASEAPQPRCNANRDDNKRGATHCRRS